MSEYRPNSFDTSGFLFAVQCVIALGVIVVGVRFGTAYAEDLILASASEGQEEAELQLLEIKAKRSFRSPDEVEFLEKLEKYEETLSTRTIGTASAESLSQAHARLIGADLANMKLYLFENGVATATIDILSKGKRGSRWETPTGLYKIETKEESHFSSIGAVYMPYSMQFFGNFFVHGWPYYPDGTQVPEGFSGGCIRLSTEDAEKVYAFASAGIPIFVWEGNASSTPIEIGSKAVPKVSAASYLVADVLSGEVYAEKDADMQRPMASISKVLTALVANETIHYDRLLTINSDDIKKTEGTPGQLPAGASFTVGDMLYPLLMESNNTVAYTLSRYHGATNFMRWVNDKAHAIGMENTSLEDPSGISANNVSTANDLFRLARYVQSSQSFILNISREKSRVVEAESGRKFTLSNFNHYSGNAQFLGGKTGYTDAAKETMMSLFEVPVGENKTTIAIIVLGSKDRQADIDKLRAWFTANAKVEATPTTLLGATD